jgi:hypothetical protein
MWIFVEADREPIILSNSPNDSLQALRQRHADATFYVCRVDGAYDQVTAHLSATKAVLVERPGETDADGNQTTVTVNEWQLIGNRCTVDADSPELQLLDNAGQAVGKLPLALVS